MSTVYVSANPRSVVSSLVLYATADTSDLSYLGDISVAPGRRKMRRLSIAIRTSRTELTTIDGVLHPSGKVTWTSHAIFAPRNRAAKRARKGTRAVVDKYGAIIDAILELYARDMPALLDDAGKNTGLYRVVDFPEMPWRP